MLKRRREEARAPLSLEALRRLNQRCDRLLGGLVAWHAFTADAFEDALAARLDGVIERRPFHWRGASLFGITLGTLDADGRRRWLILYESETEAEHQLAIILHEFMHIALGHAQATHCLRPEDLRELLRAAGIVSDERHTIAYTRLCWAADEALSSKDIVEEWEAELGAMWVLAQARRAGALAPTGQSFSAEHRALDASLRGEEDA